MDYQSVRDILDELNAYEGDTWELIWGLPGFQEAIDGVDVFLLEFEGEVWRIYFGGYNVWDAMPEEQFQSQASE